MRNRVMIRVRRWLSAASMLLGCGQLALAQETIIVPRSGAATWTEMLGAGQARRTVGPQVRRVIRQVPAPWTGRLPGPKAVFSAPATPGEFGRGGPELARRDPILGNNFQALLTDGTTIPPDTEGAIGPSNVMTMLNDQVRIQDKAGVVQETVSTETFWTTNSGLSGLPSDPRLVFDAGAGRWYAAMIANPATNHGSVWFAASVDSNPRGTWNFYEITADPTGATFPDFTGLGYNETWVAITANMGTDTQFVGAELWAIDKTSIHNGGALTITALTPGFDVAGQLSGQGPVQGFTLMPCVTVDPAESTLYIVDDSGFTDPATNVQLLRVSRLTGTGSSAHWSVQPGSAYTGTGLFKVQRDFQFTQIDASQKGDSRKISTNDPRLLWALLRNGKIWTAHTGGLPLTTPVERTVSFWYQLDPQALPNPIVQSGALDGGTDVHIYFPTIAANKYDDACIGYTISSSVTYASAGFTGRYAADTPGTMRPLQILKAGEGPYFENFGAGENRWGDYSNTSVDPADDTSFWTIQEYAATGGNKWATWWGEVLVTADCNHNGIPDDVDIANGTSRDCNNDGVPDECQTIAPPAFAQQPASGMVCLGRPATFRVVVTGTAPFQYQWRKDGQPLAGAVSDTLTIAAAATADAGTYDVLVRDACLPTSATAAASTPVTLTVASTQISTPPQDQIVAPGQSATFSVVAGGPPPLTYQWRQNGQAIGGASAASYTTPSAAEDTAGSYDVVVTTPCGTQLSAAAQLRVLAAPADPTPATGVTDQPLATTLSWSAVADATTYDVYFGTTPGPQFVANTANASWQPGGLTAGTTYYWQVAARVNDVVSPGPAWSFTTSAAPLTGAPGSGGSNGNPAAGTSAPGRATGLCPTASTVLLLGVTWGLRRARGGAAWRSSGAKRAPREPT